MSTLFQPPRFRPHPLLRGGHLQTIASVRSGQADLTSTRRHRVPLDDGDALVVHEDLPPSWASEAGSLATGDGTPGTGWPEIGAIVLVHGLCGCHAAGYMMRLARLFLDRGVAVYRLDMRGCGTGIGLASQLTHAGRSDDVMRALGWVSERTEAARLGAIGVSLGGNQLLRGLGRVGAGLDPRPDWFDRLDRVATVSPPIDLARCSDNMQRWVMRPYNYYFIRQLLSRVPPRVRERSDYLRIVAGRRPRTLRELDDRFTAPLSGFVDADQYYRQAAALSVIAANPVSTLVIAAADDPVVPIGCFTDVTTRWSQSTELLVCPSGGHVGFIERLRRSWIDAVLARWFAGAR